MAEFALSWFSAAKRECDTVSKAIDRETGSSLSPKWDEKGLIAAVVSDATSGRMLMMAYMNADALAATLDTKVAHFWSRSRGALWRKGETSGHELHVREARIDCDQDCIWLICEPQGPACHTGEASCFYRKIEDGVLIRD
jgi:phosphoribosyl-AMP cyclohydrolase